MADFYQEMAQMARDLLAPTSQGGLGQGEIKLTRKVPGTPDPTKPWEPVEPTTHTETIRGAVRGVSKELIGTEVGGTVILASDRQAICEVPKMQYTAGDVLSVDGVPVHIIAFEKIPAAGVTSAVRFTIRG
ncbi:hypothetical protein [Alcaligenes sp. WGS1538]|uniref:hypothetical protein n=1 Tax=Alcaligenes sp. WGS1538 TaxID=3366811 RepID=UPI00372D73A9